MIAVVSKRFGIGIAMVVRWLNRLEPYRTRHKPATKIDRIALVRDVRDYPDACQSERAKRLGVGEKGIGHALRRMNVTYKKHCAIPGRTPPHDMLLRRGLNAIKPGSAPSVIWTKAALPRICPVGMAIRLADNGVLACAIGR